MTCDSKGLCIRLGGGNGPPIGTLIRERRLAVFPVTYERHPGAAGAPKTAWWRGSRQPFHAPAAR